jgi:hypothetical protein
MIISPHIHQKLILLTCLELFSHSCLGGEIYRYVDSQGQIHFTDQLVNRASTGRNSANPVFSSVRIYRFIDKEGVVHLTDHPKDTRYKLVYQGNGTIQPFSGGSYSAATVLRKRYQDYAQLVQETASRTQVEAALIHAVIQAESAYNPNAVSPAGATGMMQLMRGTADRYGVSDRTDPVANVDGGSRYLRDLLTMFNGNKELAVAAYNAGENAVIRYGNTIPPYRETQNYVKTVMSLYQAYQNELH